MEMMDRTMWVGIVLTMACVMAGLVATSAAERAVDPPRNVCIGASDCSQS